MIESIGRRLRVAFSSDRTDVAAAATPDLPPEVDFVAYAEDCVLSGRVRLAADRLTDMLNAHEEYELVDVNVERLDGGPASAVDVIVAARDEILLVHAAGPRGERERRTKTITHRVTAQTGPYHVRGFLHTLPGADPLDALRRRAPMVPLTEAWIDYVADGVRHEERVDVVVVNRERVDWVTSVAAAEAVARDSAQTNPASPMAGDGSGA
jgi:hypothetical protein